MRSPWIVGVGCALLAGCAPESYLSETHPRLTAWPLFLDAGLTWVGERREVVFEVDHISGPEGHVLRADVVGVEGDAFAVELPVRVEIAREGTGYLPVVFQADEPGYFASTVTIHTDAVAGVFDVMVRGRAVWPEVLVDPGLADFGRVAVGDTAHVRVTLQNLADRPVELTEAVAESGLFEVVADDLPIAIGAGQSVQVTATCTPTDDAPVTSRIGFGIEGVAVPVAIAVRANDCEDGLPPLYDVDGDGFTTCGGDCDDDDGDVHPGAEEVVDLGDDDCDGAVDEGTLFVDDDADGFCDHPHECTDGASPGDCDDTDVAVYPGAAEDLENGRDDDCDGVVDVGDPDVDGDGWGADGGDCDDEDPAVHPGSAELPDGLDQDCDTLRDEGTSRYDDDGDGSCESDVACTDGTLPGDCDDGDPDTHPGAAEQPDAEDDDCDGDVDEGTDRGDDDGDGWNERGGDCDDADPTVNPGRSNCP